MADGTAQAAHVAVSRDGSYMDWNCVLAGALLAASLSFVLFAFGSAIGLSLVSPWTNAGASGTTLAVLTAFWIVVVQAATFAAGGYLAARMRRAWKDAKQEEVEFRDGAHRAVVWAAGVAMGAVLLAWSVAGAARTAADLGVSETLARVGVIVVGVGEANAPAAFRCRQNELLVRAALAANQRLVQFG